MTTALPAPAIAAGPTVRQLRHRAEIPMLILAGLLTAVGVAVAVWAIAGGIDIPGWAEGALIGLGLPLFSGLILIRYLYWSQISNSIEINHEQLPDIYALYLELVERMEIGYVPRLYLANGNGALNAFAAKCQVRRAYVVIFSDLVDIAFEHGDVDGVRFVLAHELGHIKCEHVALWRQGIALVPNALFIGKSVTRASEYTADRCAAYYAPEGAKSMLALFAGKRMYRHCSLDAHLRSIENHKDGLWLRVANFLSGHAVGFRRMEPLANLDETGWDVHGRML